MFAELIEQYKLAKMLRNFNKPIYKEHNWFKLRKSFAEHYRLDIPVIFDNYIFQKFVKAKNKWDNWLLYEKTVNNKTYFKSHKEFKAYRINLIKRVCDHINNKISEIKQEIQHNKQQEIIEEKDTENNSQTTLEYEMECFRRGCWNELISENNKNEQKIEYDFLKIYNQKIDEISHNNYKNCYKKQNVDHILCSIDLKSAHMQATMYLDKRILDGYDNWELFMSQFTDYELFKKSKKMRLIILGKTIHKIQSNITKYFIQILINQLRNNENGQINVIDKNDINLYVNHDEVILRLNIKNETIRNEQIKRIRNDVNELSKYFISRIELFYLKKIRKKRDKKYLWYFKQFINEQKIEIKCVPPKYFLQAYQCIVENKREIDIRHRVYMQGDDIVIARNIFK